MSIDDPFPPRRVPDWPQPVTELLPAPGYPQSINDDKPAVGHTTPLVTPTSGYATASFVLGLLGFGLLAVILGHLALRETRTGQRGGHGLAVAGLVFGYLETAVWVVVITMIIIGLAHGTSS